MRTVNVMTAEEMANELRKHNIVVLEHTEGDDVQDGEVKITPVISVQVPNIHSYGFGVSRTNPDGTITCSGELATVDDVVAYIEGLI